MSMEAMPLGPELTREDVIARALGPYFMTIDRLYSVGVNTGISDLVDMSMDLGRQQMRVLEREGDAFDQGVYAPDSPESLFPVRDGVFPYTMTDPEYPGHEDWIRDILPLQQRCSAVGKLAVAALREFPQLTEPLAMREDEITIALGVVLVDDTVTKLIDLTEEENEAMVYGTEEMPFLGISYSEGTYPSMTIQVKRMEGQSLKLKYRRGTTPVDDRNGWTITDGDENFELTGRARENSRVIFDEDLNLITRALDRLRLAA